MRPRYHCSLETTLISLVLAVRRETFTAHGLDPRLWTAVRTATRTVLLALIWLPCPLYAFGSSPEEIAARAPVAEINVKEGVTVKGYDVVAYFTDRIPVKGSPDYMYQWKGPPSSSDVPNIVRFCEQSREIRAPIRRLLFVCNLAWQRGGYRTKQWKILGGRLYLDNNSIAQGLWVARDPEVHIKKGDFNGRLTHAIHGG